MAIVVAKNRPKYLFFLDDSLIKTNNQIIKDILKETNGEFIFQEQLMEILQKVFKLSPKDSFEYMKHLSKKNEKSLIFLEEKRKQYPELINEINQIGWLAPYVCCKAHSLSYALAAVLKLM